MMLQYFTMRTPSPMSKSGMLEQLGTGNTHAHGLGGDIFRWLSLRQQQQRPDSNSIIWLQPAVLTEHHAVIANKGAAAHIRYF